MSDVFVEYMVDGYWVEINVDSLEELMKLTVIPNKGEQL